MRFIFIIFIVYWYCRWLLLKLNTNQEYLYDRYEKPNWLLEFSAQNLDSYNLNQNYEKYVCTAQIVTLDEFLQQSQTNVQELSQTISGDTMPIKNLESYPYDLGRECEQELDQEILD